MSLQEVCGFLSGVFQLAAFLPYIYAILRGTTKPQKASWIIWATVDTLIFLGMWLQGSLNVQMMVVIFGAWTVGVLAVMYGESGWSRLDKISLGGAVIGIALMFLSAAYGLFASLAVLFIGSFPTFKSVYLDPSKEDKTTWIICLISTVLAIIAIPAWTFKHTGQPLTFFAIQAIVVYLICIRPVTRAAALSTAAGSK